jgi:two-component system, chemotaxis family, sensor kinase CheA
MTNTDPELLKLLVQELDRHLEELVAWETDPTPAKRALHALRGSAGLAGERELAAALERLERRVRQDDDTAWDEAKAVVRSALKRLAEGESAVRASWPVPPPDLVALPINPLVRAQYAAEVTDRLARIDEALATSDDPLQAVQALYRHVHTMKGAASAAGDELMTWFCHGLEEKIRAADSKAAARTAMDEVAHWRVVLGALLDEPEAALARLGGRRRPISAEVLPVPGASPTGVGSEPPRTASDGAMATIRVPAADVDTLLEKLDVIDRAREPIGSRARRGHAVALSMRQLRATLVEALRLIGPSRPWGAPAAALKSVQTVASALAAFGDEIDVASARLRASEQVLRESVIDAKKQLSAMRQTTVGRIFARLTTAIESEARRAGRSVIVRTRGADETIDRHIAEQLVEPCLQLVRNAVAHGIEAPQVRADMGKSPSGTIALTARKSGSRLGITISDDGAGVDVADIRARAVKAGLVTPAIADAADDDTLLSLLFLPGFSTRQSSDLLAGRGIGLDITRSSVQRMGGAIRLSSRAGKGLSAQVEVPIESGFVMVLWVRAGDDEFALPAANARRVQKSDAALKVPHLLACLDVANSGATPYAIDLSFPTDDTPEPPVLIGVDEVGSIEELLVRPVGPLIAGLGPFAGAIVRGDGSVRLAIDAWAIAPRARALAAALPALRGSGPAGRA